MENGNRDAAWATGRAPYSEAEVEEREQAISDMERIRTDALASGLRTWSRDEVNEYLARVRAGEPTDDLVS